MGKGWLQSLFLFSVMPEVLIGHPVLLYFSSGDGFWIPAFAGIMAWNVVKTYLAWRNQGAASGAPTYQIKSNLKIWDYKQRFYLFFR